MARLAVGYVARAHGIRGELRVHLHAPGSTALEGASVLFIDGVAFELDSARAAADAWLVRLVGVEDRDRAESLAGKPIEIERAELHLAEGEYLVADLVGCACEDPDGAPLGVIHAIVHGPQDLLVVRDAGRKVERLVPLVPELVPAVDIEARRVVLDLPEGLPEEPC
jgi:16S rRNA processing protein RimM